MAGSDLWEESSWTAHAREHGWERPEEGAVLFFHRPAPAGSRRFYLSAGIHGDEPAGPLAVFELMREKRLWDGWEVFLFPMLNPAGLRRGTRESEEGLDLNREYGSQRSPQISAHLALLQKLPRFDLALCLHEDWEARGVYLYYLHRSGNLEVPRRVLGAMGEIIPVEESAVIDGREADRGLIHRRPEEYEGDDWPEAIYLGHHHTDTCYTLETPSAFPLDERILAHCQAVRVLAEEGV
jgi:murein peptide amidase A